MASDRHPKVVVSALIEKDGKFLLAKEILESGKEYWIIPGGGVEFGESLTEAVKREIKEELNLDIEIIKFLDFKEVIVTKYDYHTIVFLFLAKPLNSDIVLEEKILKVRFFTKDEIKNLNVVNSAKMFLDDYFNGH